MKKDKVFSILSSRGLSGRRSSFIHFLSNNVIITTFSTIESTLLLSMHDSDPPFSFKVLCCNILFTRIESRGFGIFDD